MSLSRNLVSKTARSCRAALALFAGAAALLPPGAAAEPIAVARLGAVYAFSGPIAIYSTTIKNGLELALAEVNAQGAPKIELTMEDDRSTKDDAINVYQKFIQRDNDLLIFGPLTGGQVFAAAPLAQKARVPVMLTSVATPGVTNVGDYIFRSSVDSATIIPSTVKAAKDLLHVKKVAQIYTNDDQADVGEYKAYDAALKANGIEILDVETVRTGDVDFSAQLTKIKAANPDAVVITTQGQEAVGLMTQARKLGIDKAVFLGGNSFNAAGVVKETGKAMEGALSATPWFLGTPNPKNVDFVKRYRGKYGADPDWLAAQSYDAVFIVKQALVDARIDKGEDIATARTKLRDALAAIKSYEGAMGRIEFAPNRDPIIAGSVIKVQDGKHVPATSP